MSNNIIKREINDQKWNNTKTSKLISFWYHCFNLYQLIYSQFYIYPLIDVTKVVVSI